MNQFLKPITPLLLCLSLQVMGQEKPIWKDASQSFEARTEDLLKRMTVEEKISWFSSDIPAIPRLGIPAYMWYNEALHGVMSFNCTSFPQNNAMGSTWDKDLMFDVAAAISDEVRATTLGGKAQVMIYSPTVNMARDPRWGRNEECYSEDPFMMSQMARMYIRGMQGTHPKYLKTVCTVKHYVANNVEKGRERHQSMISERDLREYYFPAYKDCIVEERAGGIMTALNGLNGIPCSAHDWLVNTVLREEWGFKGYVVADWAGVKSVQTNHKYAKSQVEAALLALRSGVDQECFRPKASPMRVALAQAWKQGLVKESELDTSLRRLIRLRFMVNGFGLDEACPYNAPSASLRESKAHRDLALKAAQKSIVLLKNEKKTLPLDASEIQSVAVVGPFADQCWLGIYSGWPKHKTSPLQGIQARFKGKVNFAKGCAVTAKEDKFDMNQAIEAAKKSDVVIAFVGNDNQTSTENTDRKTLGLPGRQQELLDKLCEVHDQVIVVIVPSGSTTIGQAQQEAEAILVGWANGQEQGNAIADVLFGDVNPGGKLNTTWYASDNDLPDFNDYNIRNNRTYMYFQGKPLYPFGYGLSYTQFKLSKLQVSDDEIEQGEDIKVTVNIKNTGKVKGDEVVQLYVKNEASKAVEAKQALQGFERVSLNPGESKTLSFTLPYEAYKHWDEQQKAFVVAEGAYEIRVGNSSEHIKLTQDLEVEGGKITETTVQTVNLAHYDANPRYRSQYYPGKVPTAIAQVSKDQESADKWVEYEINFQDPGFYVSEWEVRLKYSSNKDHAKASVVLDNVNLANCKLAKGENATHVAKIPKPEYGVKTKVRILLDQAIELKGIEVIWPKDNSINRYQRPTRKSK